MKNIKFFDIIMANVMIEHVLERESEGWGGDG